MDHDRLFKELLGTFFLDFLRLFLPELASEIEEASLVPLDKEIFTDVAGGERHEVDLLVQARLVGEPSLFLIHVETQAKRQKDFSRRMFNYFARLYAKFQVPIYPVAVFSYSQPRRLEPDEHEVSVAGFEILHFRFKAIQLNHMDWRMFRDTPNPVAAALMARMHIAPRDRARVKWECYRLLATLKLDPARTQVIGVFIDAYLTLGAEQEQEFEAHVAAMLPRDREVIMELSTPWHRWGRAEGRQEEASFLILKLLNKRLGTIPEDRLARIQALPVERLESLADAIFEIERIDDLDRHLDAGS